jgi:hypothetical protein
MGAKPATTGLLACVLWGACATIMVLPFAHAGDTVLCQHKCDRNTTPICNYPLNCYDYVNGRPCCATIGEYFFNECTYLEGAASGDVGCIVISDFSQGWEQTQDCDERRDDQERRWYECVITGPVIDLPPVGTGCREAFYDCCQE